MPLYILPIVFNNSLFTTDAILKNIYKDFVEISMDKVALNSTNNNFNSLNFQNQPCFTGWSLILVIVFSNFFLNKFEKKMSPAARSIASTET